MYKKYIISMIVLKAKQGIHICFSSVLSVFPYQNDIFKMSEN